jgi:predicted N-acetyltransferase YhbS
MNVYLRLEQPQEYRIVEELTREAFWGMDHPDCNEHLLVHKVAFCFCICAGA